MDSTESRRTCIIIAAKNAEATIGRAIASALVQPETAEVVVIDDGSNDETAAKARDADDGTGRLNVVKFEDNRGPAAARNYAISISRSPIIGILDADDFFFPGRLKQLFREKDWDFVADNVAFIDAAQAASAHENLRFFAPGSRLLDFVTFVEGNISRRNALRGEIGFLKPLMRRAFLDEHQIRYNETLRLGEDYDLYARALAKGGRYAVIHSCGYAAVVRSDSLSGSHRTIDLKRLYEADRAIAKEIPLGEKAMAVLQRHERHVRHRYEQRHFLDLKRQQGLIGALGYLLKNPGAVAPITTGIFLDKTAVFRRPRSPGPMGLGGSGDIRYLLNP